MWPMGMKETDVGVLGALPTVSAVSTMASFS
jgi:hypothetical protein